MRHVIKIHEIWVFDENDRRTWASFFNFMTFLEVLRWWDFFKESGIYRVLWHLGPSIPNSNFPNLKSCPIFFKEFLAFTLRYFALFNLPKSLKWKIPATIPTILSKNEWCINAAKLMLYFFFFFAGVNNEAK